MRNILQQERTKMCARLSRLQTTKNARLQKQQQQKFEESQNALREQRLRHFQLVQSLERPEPTQTTEKPRYTTQFQHDMQDFDSSAVDSQVSQSDPEIVFFFIS